MYKLVYIRGISAYDTPHFSSQAKQEDFFDNLDGVEVDAYYPPFYTNTIKVDVDDCSDITKYNYLILYTSNKTYYYFISNPTYINEDIMTIDIVMDTVQTYMFNMIFNESLISRKSMKRWIVNNNVRKINRNYIRENLSVASKKVFTYEKVNSSRFFILQTRYNYSGDSNITSTEVISNNMRFNNGCYYYLIPIPREVNPWEEVIIYNIQSTPTSYIGSYANEGNTLLIKRLVEDPNTINIFYVDNAFFKSLTFEWQGTVEESGYGNVSQIKLYEDTNFKFSANPQIQIPRDYDHPEGTKDKFLGFLIEKMPSDFYHDITRAIWFDSGLLTNNSSTGVNFSTKYIPQLLDENYYELTFGERMCATSYPLHKAEKTTFTFYYNYDMFSGFRNYRILEEGATDDVYLTTTVSATIESVDLYTDAWLTYQVQHKGDLTIGLKTAYAQNLYNGVKSIAGGFGTHNLRTTTFDEGGIEKASMGLYSASSNKMKVVTGITDTIINNASIQAELWKVQDNMESTPDTTRCGNSFYNDFINNSLDNVIITIQCEDFETVGKKLEYHGYKVNEYTNENIFDYCKIRYYYNVVKVDNTLFDLNILTTADIIERIKERLTAGIRLWDMEHNSYITEGLKYDNVELEEL